MKKIYKYPLSIDIYDATAAMKIGARILCAHSQGKQICVWALVDVDAKFEDRHFTIYPTGGSQTNIPESATYIDTVHMSNGEVWHLFERST